MIMIDSSDRFLCFTDGVVVYIYEFLSWKKIGEIEMPEGKDLRCMHIYKATNSFMLVVNDSQSGIIVIEKNHENEGFIKKYYLKNSKCNMTELNEKNGILYGLFGENCLKIWDLNKISENNEKNLEANDQIRFWGKFNNFHMNDDLPIFLMFNKNCHKFFLRESTETGNNFLEVLSEKYQKINPTYRDRNQIICSNKNFTIVAVNILAKNSEEDIEPNKCELYIYANNNGHDITLIKKISEETKSAGLNLECNIYVITQNPVFSNLFVFGDSKGRLTIFDADSLEVVNFFRETCYHVGAPQENNPILEAQFLRNGTEIIVGTFFGNVIMYSTNGNSDQISMQPKEQFFVNDYINENFENDGFFCNSQFQEHLQCEKNDEKSIKKFLIKKYKNVLTNKEKLKELDNLNFYEKKEFEEEKKKKIFERFELDKEPEFTELITYEKKEKSNIEKIEENSSKENNYSELDPVFSKRGRKRNFYYREEKEEDIEDDIIEDEEGDSFYNPRRNYSNSLLKSDEFVPRRSNRRSFLKSDEFVPRRSSRRRKRRTSSRLNSINKIEKLEKIEKDNKIEKVTKSEFHEIPRRSRLKKLSENFILNKNCNYCELILDTRNNHCKKCAKNFCKECSDILLIYKREYYLCYKCYFEEKEDYNYKKKIYKFRKNCTRDFFDNLNHFEIDEELGVCVYTPQIDEEYYFVYLGFLEFLKQYYMIMDNFDMDKILSIRQDLLCKVVAIDYYFPQVFSKYDWKKYLAEDKFFILQKIKLEILEDVKFGKYLNGNSLKKGEIFEISFSFTRNLDTVFLIPKNLYNLSKNVHKYEKNNTIINYMNQDLFLKKTTKIYNSLYGSLILINSKRNSHGRKKNRTEDLKCHPWYLSKIFDKFSPPENLFENKNLIKKIDNIIERNYKKFFIFKEDVDKEVYSDYMNYIEIEINLSKILERLKNNYYYSKKQLKFEIELIKRNAVKYNEEDSPVCDYAESLMKELFKIIDEDREKDVLSRRHHFENNN